MANIELSIIFLIYFLTLFIGFNLFSKEKDKHNLNYKYFKNFLYILLGIISIISAVFLFQLSQLIPWVLYILLIQILYTVYFFLFTFRRTRCWKQHRMVIYNFLLIPAMYLFGLVFENNYEYIIYTLIFIYNIAEFQFAKFNMNQCLIWD